MPARPRNSIPSANAEELPFEKALEELEGIVESLDGDVKGLDEMVTQYERGMGLLKTCQTQLDAAQLRIEHITRRADGALETTPVAAAGTGTGLTRPEAGPAATPSPPAKSDDEIRLF